jgi:hypothetical protein
MLTIAAIFAGGFLGFLLMLVYVVGFFDGAWASDLAREEEERENRLGLRT